MKWHGQVWIFGIQGQVTTMWIVKSGQIMNLSKSLFFFIVISASFYKDQIKTYMNHDMTKPTMWLCAKWRFGSAWASAQSDQSLRLSGQRRFWSDWADAQADLSLCWEHTHFVGFVMSWLIWTMSISFLGYQEQITVIWPDEMFEISYTRLDLWYMSVFMCT